MPEDIDNWKLRALLTSAITNQDLPAVSAGTVHMGEGNLRLRLDTGPLEDYECEE